MPKAERDAYTGAPIHPGEVGGLEHPTLDIPADALPKEAPRQQEVRPGETVWIGGPDGTNPLASGRAEPQTMRGAWVELVECPKCFEWFPRLVRGSDADTRCARCIFATGLPELPEVVRGAMERLRWRLRSYLEVRERDLKREHDAFVDYTQEAYATARIFLAFLEKLYGDQVVLIERGLLLEEDGDTAEQGRAEAAQDFGG